MDAAFFNSNPDLITALIKCGADVNAREKNGLTALMFAARWGKYPEMITALIGGGANVNLRDEEGKLAIDYASENPDIKNTDVYRRLKEAANKR
jgi:ankyrin repeat protein